MDAGVLLDGCDRDWHYAPLYLAGAGENVALQAVPRSYAAIPQTRQGVRIRLGLPEHVNDTLSDWASSEIGCTVEDVLEMMAEELCTNEELRNHVAGPMEA